MRAAVPPTALIRSLAAMARNSGPLSDRPWLRSSLEEAFFLNETFEAEEDEG